MKYATFGVLIVSVVVDFAKAQNFDLVQFVTQINTNYKGNWFSLITTEGKEHISKRDFRLIFKNIIRKSAGRRVVLKSNYDHWNSGDFLAPKDSKYTQEFICFWDPSIVAYLERAGNKSYFASKHFWLIILNQNDTLEEVKESLKEVAFYIDSEVIVSQFTKLDEQSHWTLYEIWRIGPNTDVLVKSLGVWSSLRGLEFSSQENKYRRRSDLQGFHMRVATIKTMPYISMFLDETLQNFESGYAVDVWNILQDYLNFTYSAKNTLFGSLQKDGVSWNGMVGRLQQEGADVAVAPLSITENRARTIDFTIPIQIVRSRLYIRRPPLGATWLLYTLPFEGALWICIPFTIIITGTWMWALNRGAIYFHCDADTMSLFQAIWVMFSGFVQQPSLVKPKPISAKMLFVIGFLSSLIFINVYSGMLVSILTTLEAQYPFRDFDELRRKPDWDVGVRTNTALSDALALSPIETSMRYVWYRNIATNPIKNLPDSNQIALQYVLEGKYAYFANQEYIIYIMQKEMPVNETVNIVDTKIEFLVRGIGFGLQKRSPYTNILNYYLKRMTIQGHLHRLKMKWWPNISSEPDNVYPSPGLKEVCTVFLLLCLGLILSLLFLSIEKCSNSKKKKVKKISLQDLYFE